MNEPSLLRNSPTIRRLSATTHVSLLKEFCSKGLQKNRLVQQSMSFSKTELSDDSEFLKESREDISTTLEESSICQAGPVSLTDEPTPLMAKLDWVLQLTAGSLAKIRETLATKEIELALLRWNYKEQGSVNGIRAAVCCEAAVQQTRRFIPGESKRNA
jgi:hypothetical protein